LASSSPSRLTQPKVSAFSVISVEPIRKFQYRRLDRPIEEPKRFQSFEAGLDVTASDEFGDCGNGPVLRSHADKHCRMVVAFSTEANGLVYEHL
jgi:hypothetical protein